VALITRREYPRALADNLRDDRLDFSALPRDWSALLNEADRALLREKASAGTRGEQRIAAVLLWRVRDPLGRRAVFRLLASGDAAELPQLRPALALLAQADPDTNRETTRWLAGPEAPSDPEVLDELAGVGLIAARREGTNSPLPALARKEDEGGWTLRAIRDAGDLARISDVLGRLANENTAIRTSALRTLGNLATPAEGALLDRVLPLLPAATTEQRHLILQVVARIGDPAGFARLLRALDNFTAAEARAVEALLVEAGSAIVPTLVDVMRDRSAPARARAVGLRALSRVAPTTLFRIELEQLELELREAEQRIRAHTSLVAAYPGATGPLAVLNRFYRDSAVETLALVLELLGRTGRLPDCELIRASLWGAGARDRANALEAVQQSCARPTFNRMLRVIEATQGSASAPVAGEVQPVDAVLRQAAGSTARLERLAARLVLGGAGVSGVDRELLEAVAVLL
ncbi:MAG: HEAT repeat domain-containing protein, partial [Solirubrobacteraceae bacterium]